MLWELVKDRVVLREVWLLSASFNTSAKDFDVNVLTLMIVMLQEVSGQYVESILVEFIEALTLKSGGRIKGNSLTLARAGLGLTMKDFGEDSSFLNNPDNVLNNVLARFIMLAR